MRPQLTGRRFAAVLLLCVLVSTQVLFQPGLFGYWSLEQAAYGWLDFLIEALLCGIAMWMAATFAERFLPAGGGPHHAGLALAILAAALPAYLLSVALLQPKGFYPPPLNAAGDALRWAIMGWLVASADAHVRLAAHAAAALADAEVASAMLEKQMVEARLQVLQAQIEPHFLFNTLAHVKRLYRVDARTGNEMLGTLRHYLQAAIPQVRRGGSTLAEEIELVRAYLRLLGLRMGARLQFSIDVEPAASSREFPAMVILTLVENSIKHGIGPRPQGGAIAITAAMREDALHVAVADDGAGFHGNSGTGVGLANIRARLSGLHGERAVLTLQPNRPRGVVAQVVVPA